MERRAIDMIVTPDTFSQSTERMLLRPPRADDEQLYRDLYTDAASMRLIGPPLSSAAAIRSYRHTLSLLGATPMRGLLMVIEERESGRPIGLVGAPGFDPDATRLEMGLMLHRLAHGKGYPKEVLIAFTETLFAVLPVEEIWVQYPVANKAADRAIRNIGFEINESAMAATGDHGICIRSACRQAWANFLHDRSLSRASS